MRLRFLTARLITANLLIPISILIFAVGFFPYKPFIPGRAVFESSKDDSRARSSPFNKVIFMVVDALRSDFVYGPHSGFQFTQSLIRDGSAIPFTAHATSPTITMPRVKAITTGSIPSFLDVILNFAESDTTSSLANQDTWLSQLKDTQDGKVVMYGDDTWLKLFPDTFARADGTTSFFVSDFTEVDNNVTRNVSPELKMSDWNGMIMHYLGLDHIGHKTGPQGPNMLPKQREMDGIVRTIYEAIEMKAHLQSTLLVLAGDHGMNDAGNHGGSAESETSPALVFISPKLHALSRTRACPVTLSDGRFDYYDTVEQSDVAPTLAGLLGFPIPLNNLGVFIPGLLTLWNIGDRIRLMKGNAEQMLKIAKQFYPNIDFDAPPNYPSLQSQSESSGDHLHRLWQNATTANFEDKTVAQQAEILDSLSAFCKHAQQTMSNTASNYNIKALGAGIALSGVAFLVAVTAFMDMPSTDCYTRIAVFLVAGLYVSMMFASSYVEEEQQFWYWVTTGWSAWLSHKRCSRDEGNLIYRFAQSLSLLTALRTLWRWNQTGQKRAGAPDIARNFLPRHPSVLWTLVFATYGYVALRLGWRRWSVAPHVSQRVSAVMLTLLVVIALNFKIAFTAADAPELLRGLPTFLPENITTQVSLVTQARAVFAGVLFGAVYIVYPRPGPLGQSRIEIATTLHDVWTLFLITQTRTTNIPIFLTFALVHTILRSWHLSPSELSLTSLLIQFASFFALGGSNAISSVDLSNAYNGVSGYNVGAVGVLTFVGNWAGPLWWTSATTLSLLQQQGRQQGRGVARKQGQMAAKTTENLFARHAAVLTLFATGSTVSVMLACTLLRTHLFIWTVFSPKYLYIMAWNIVHHVVVNLIFGGLAFWALSP